MKHIYIWITTLLVIYGVGVEAQEAALTGKVVDEQQQPLDLATVHLLNASDSSVLRTVFADEQGGFSFTGTAQGSYRVMAVLVGYDDVVSEPFAVAVDETAKDIDRKSTRLNSSHVKISYAVF